MNIFAPRLNFRPFEYPTAFSFQNAQSEHYWTHTDIEVDADLVGYKTDFTPEEQHGISTVLKLFTTYEVLVADYWVEVIYRWFPKPEIRAMAQTFSAIEAEHALFYDKLNNKLGLSTEEFYLEFTKDKAMQERVSLITEYINGATDERGVALSLAAFSFIEGVILYSSFAFLLSFQQAPKNKLKHIAAGLKYSVRDEALHSDAGSWLFNTLTHESALTGLTEDILTIAEASYDIEEKIIDNIFSKGTIKGITAYQMKEFIKSRINLKLKDIGIAPLYKVEYNPISRWFYKTINAIEVTDFFDQRSSEYKNSWNFSKIDKW